MNNRDIRFLVMDVDGTLTDGKIYMGNEGELFKAFDAKDGYGIHEILPRHGIEPVIITGRKSEILSRRCRELDIKELHQGIREKLAVLEKILAARSEEDKKSYSPANVAYIGDDMPDISCMRSVKAAGGAVGCPADAVNAVKETADFVSSKKGGEGAVREFIEWLAGQDAP